MLISRRNFFQVSLLSAVAPLAASDSIFGQTADASGDPLINLRAGDFRNQIGTKFKLSIGTAFYQAVLTDVQNFQSSGEKRFDERDRFDPQCFSLTFSIIGAHLIKQATYDVKHRSLGNFQLFLVPGEPSLSQPMLVAVINRTH